MGKEVGGLPHQVDAQVVVVEAHVHVHSADEHAAGNDLVVLVELLVALGVGEFLRLPGAERMCRCGDDGVAVFAGEVGQNGPEFDDLGGSLRHGGALPGPDREL